jgi:hypothetical protein
VIHRLVRRSEVLVVVGSEAAADSHELHEEIRQFVTSRSDPPLINDLRPSQLGPPSDAATMYSGVGIRDLRAHANNSRRDGCPETVPELLLLTRLELSLERKQIPQVVENVESE